MSSYKRKSDRGKWDAAKMTEAIYKVRNKKMTFGEASSTFNVPKSTLFRRVREKNVIAVNSTKHLGRFQNTFDSTFENELKQYIFDMESRLFGITNYELREMAYELAEKNNLQHNFNQNKKIAGKKWLYSFRKRNKDVTVRKPEAISYSRATGFNRVAVNKFFILLSDIITKYKIDGSRIFNCDETGMKTVQQQHAKILAKTGRKQVGVLTSADRGKNVTVICTVSSIGNFLPPCFIFPRKRENPVLMDNAPTSAKGFFNDNGWMTSDIFCKYLRHFIEFARPSKDYPCLLILDGHASHTKNINALDLARDNGIIMLSLPPHTTHKLQPLDVGIFKPLQTYYDRYIDRWLRSHPGRTFTEYQIAGAFTEAYGKAGTIEIATNAFKQCGIWPLNPDIFNEADFAASETTDNSQNTVTARTLQSVTEPSSSGINEISRSEPPIPSTPSTSFIQQKHHSPSDLFPIPKVPDKNEYRKKRRSESCIELTSSPYKELLSNIDQGKKNGFKKPCFSSTQYNENPCFVKKSEKAEKNIYVPRKHLMKENFNSEFKVQNSLLNTKENKTVDDLEFENPTEITEAEKQSLAVDDFVLVKFETKTKITHYIGKLMTPDEDGDWIINYLKRQSHSNFNFIFPDNVEVFTVKISDIVLKLPKANETARTLRLARFFNFPVNLTNIQNIC